MRKILVVILFLVTAVIAYAEMQQVEVRDGIIYEKAAIANEPYNNGVCPCTTVIVDTAYVWPDSSALYW